MSTESLIKTITKLKQQVELLKTNIVNSLLDKTKKDLLKWKKTSTSCGSCFYTLALDSCTIILSRIPAGKYQIAFSDNAVGIIGTSRDALDLWDFIQTKEKLDNLSYTHTKLDTAWRCLQDQTKDD